jgi:hypothetical protein
MSACTKDEFGKSITPSKRLHYNGSNLGNIIGAVIAPAYDSLWQLPCGKKHDVHGIYRVPCGGPTDGDESVGRGCKRKTTSTKEPTFWHSRALMIYETLIADYHVHSIIDLTPGDGVLMIQCAIDRIPYFGFTLSPAHAEQLKIHATHEILKRMFLSSSKLYDPELAMLFKSPISDPSASATAGPGNIPCHTHHTIPHHTTPHHTTPYNTIP